MQMGGIRWTDSDIEVLLNLWGQHTIPEISRITGRSINSIHVKSVRLGLGGQYKRGDIMNANQVAKLLGVDRHAVTDRWIKKYGLPAKQKYIYNTKKKRYWVIKYDDLIKWLKNNPNKWSSKNADKLFGVGEKWYAEKHNQDISYPKNRFKKWSTLEDQTALYLFYNKGLNCRQISERMDRSAPSIERRLSRLQKRMCEDARNGTNKFL